MSERKASFLNPLKSLPVQGSATAVDKHVAKDLTWMDALKGMAIIGVVFDHWVPLWNLGASTGPFALLSKIPWGSPVHLFFLLSGFGLMMAYLNKQGNWNWKRWIWRRVTKIIVPYWLAVLFSIVLGVLGSNLYNSIDLKYSWKSVAALLTFTRSLFPTSWAWNAAFWFMPIIIGLYFCFPIMARILQKRGPWYLFILSIFLTYGSIAGSAILSGRYRGHNETCFLYFVIQFALGMILALKRWRAPDRLNMLVDYRALLLGISFYIVSWAVKSYFPNGEYYNDLLTTIGVFLVFLNLFWTARLKMPMATKILADLGRMSYLIFLIHYPILAFLIVPPARNSLPPMMIPILGLIFVSAIYFFCLLISKPLDRLTSWLYNQSMPA